MVHILIFFLFTFNEGDLKRILAQETGLEPQEQRLLFRGKQKDDDECLHMVGVKDMSKIVLMEDPASKERKLEEMKRNEGISRACEAIAQVRAEVDKLSEKVSPKGAKSFCCNVVLYSLGFIYMNLYSIVQGSVFTRVNSMKLHLGNLICCSNTNIEI